VDSFGKNLRIGGIPKQYVVNDGGLWALNRSGSLWFMPNDPSLINLPEQVEFRGKNIFPDMNSRGNVNWAVSFDGFSLIFRSKGLYYWADSSGYVDVLFLDYSLIGKSLAVPDGILTEEIMQNGETFQFWKKGVQLVQPNPLEYYYVTLCKDYINARNKNSKVMVNTCKVNP